MRRYSKSLVIGVFLVPYLVLLYHMSSIGSVDSRELLWVLKNTLAQSALSSILCVFFGVFGALGLAWVSDRYPKYSIWLETLLILPNFLPPIFLAYSALYWIRPFPYGYVGISLTHVLMNVGLVSVICHGIFQSKVGSYAELALIEGATTWQFLRSVLRQMLFRELLIIAAFIFTMCLSSFVIPLLTGGEQGVTLEVLIYQKVRWSSHFSQAMSLSAVQMGLLIVVAFVVPKSTFRRQDRRYQLDLLHQPLGLLIPLLAVILVFTAPFLNLLSVGFTIFHNMTLWSLVPRALLTSLFLSFGTGFLIFIFLQISLLWGDDPFFRKFFQFFQAPSTALMGLSLVLLAPSQEFLMPALTCFALSLIFYPIVYRMRWKEQIDSLHGQVILAQTLGADEWQIFKEITFSQSKGVAGSLSGICAFWALGDFAIPTFLLPTDATLAQIMEDLLGSYRMGFAGSFYFLIALVGSLVFLLFKEMPYVFGRKSPS